MKESQGEGFFEPRDQPLRFVPDRIVKPPSSPTTRSQQKNLFRSPSLPARSTTTMAGDISGLDQNTKQRKRWTTIDRSVLNVNLLRANLAEDGCEEAQLDVAKRLLEDCEDLTTSESTQRENVTKAVYWLVKSAEQGNLEATELLEQSLKTGRGITHQNIADVMSCIGTPKNEKLVFKAARRLYDKLSNGEEFITTTQILGFEPLKTKPENQLNDNEDESPNKTFTVSEDEEDNSHLDADGRPQANSTARDEALNNNEDDLVRRLMEHEGVKLTRDDLLEIAKSYNNGEVPSVSISGKMQISPPGNYYYAQSFSYFSSVFLLELLLLSIFMKALTLHSVLLVILSWSLVLTSVKLLAWPKKLAVFHEWTTAFKNVLQTSTTSDFSNEAKLISTQLHPLYMLSLLCLGLLTLIVAPPPELSLILSVLSVWSIFRGSMNLTTRWQTLVMITTTVGSAPGLYQIYSDIFQFIEDQIVNAELLGLETIREWDYLKFLQFMDFQGTVVVVNLAIIVESYFRNWKFTDVLEPFVLYMWFLKLVTSCSSLETSGVLLCTGVVVAFVAIIYFVESRKALWKIILGTAMVTVVGSLIGLSILIFCLDVTTKDQHTSPVFWEEYKMNCHRKAWETKTVPETRVLCWQLYENNPALVAWAGKINTMKVSKIEKSSSLHHILDSTDAFEVFFDILVNVDSYTKEPEGSSWQNLLTGQSKDKEILNVVSMLVTTKDISGIEKKKRALNRLLNLRIGDVVQFRGLLVNGAGGLKPEVSVQTLHCVDCVVPNVADLEDDSGFMMTDEEIWSFTPDSVTQHLFSRYEDYIGSQPMYMLRELEVGLRDYLEAAKDMYIYVRELMV